MSGEARWLEVQIAGQPQQPRTLLAGVPYAVKAADAATLGGLHKLAGRERMRQLFLTGDPVPMLHQKKQQVEAFAAERNRLLLPHQRPADAVDYVAVKADLVDFF